MLIQMRGCPTWKTKRTPVIAIIAPTAITPESLVRWYFWKTKASGSLLPAQNSGPYGKYKTYGYIEKVVMIRAYTMALEDLFGIPALFSGVEMASNRYRQKKTPEMPFIIPANPLGANGCQFPA